MKTSKLTVLATVVASAVFPVSVGALTTEVGGVTYRVLTPVAATAQNTYLNDDRAAIHAIDGSGMSSSASTDVHSITAQALAPKKSWLSDNISGTWIAFDLGEEREIAGFHLWNYNDVNFTALGIRTAGVYVGAAMPTNGDAYDSAGEAWGTLVKDMTFTEALGLHSYTGEDYFFDEPVRGRYFQFKIPDNFSDEYDFAGISEIVFYEITTDSEVTRLASGMKSIGGLTNGTVSVTEGASGAAAPITLDGTTVRAASIRTVAGTMYGGTPQIDLGGNTLAVESIDLPAGAAGLEMSHGFLTRGEGECLWDRNLLRLNAEEDLTLHANFTANGDGALNVTKIGAGDLTVDGTNSCVEALDIQGGLLCVTGGATKVRVLSAPGNAVSVSNGGKLGFGEASDVTKAFSLVVDGGVLSLPLPAPIIHYNFDSISDGRVPNLGSGGAAYDGVVNGSPAIVNDGVGCALKFSANTHGVTTANEVPIRFYTFAAWVKSTGGTRSYWQRIVIAQTDYAGYLGTDVNNHFTAFVRVWDDDPKDRFGNSADTKNWHHVAMTYDGYTMKCYLDGVLTVSKPLTHEIKEYSMKLGIGNNPTPNSEYWRGMIDEVYVFDHALSEGEVAILKERSGRARGTWIPWYGKVQVGPDGATFDATDAVASLEGAVSRPDGAAVRKTGANTLMLKNRIEGAGPVNVEEGTLALALSAPVIHYDFEDVGDGKVPNLGTGGEAYDGVVNGSPETVDGVTGNALKFSESTHGVATASAVPVRFYTFAAWVKSAGARTRVWQRIVMAGTDFAGYLGSDDTGRHFTAFVRRWENDSNDLFGNSADTENWHHVAMTYDGYTMKCYLDGVIMVNKPLTHEIKEYSMKLGIGNNATPNTEYWNGAIDEVYVFDRALSAAEVVRLKDRSWRAMNAFDPASELSIADGATLDLGDVDQTVATLSLAGRLQRKGAATWGAIGSGAKYETPMITGSGILRVKGPGSGFMLIVK